MRTLKWNGENWYMDERSLWKRIRQWVIWIGGWEKPNGKGWQFYNPYDLKRGEKRLMPSTPISLFGHSITFYGWGGEVRFWKRHYLVWSRTSGVYVSSDGTPPCSDKVNTRGFFIYRARRKRSKHNGKQASRFQIRRRRHCS